MAKSTKFSAPFLHYSLPPDTKIICTRVSFKVKTTDIDNKYDIYSIKFEDGSPMLEGVDLSVSYPPVYVVVSFHIIIAIASTEN